MDHQQSGSWTHDRDEGEDEQVLQPKIKRKRSIRVRPRHTAERPEERSCTDTPLHRGDSSLLPFQMDNKYPAQLRTDTEMKAHGESNSLRHDQSEPSSKSRRNLPSRKIANAPKSRASLKTGRLNCMPGHTEDAADHFKESWDGKIANASGSSNFSAKMSDVIQRRVCTVSLLHYGF